NIPLINQQIKDNFQELKQNPFLNEVKNVGLDIKENPYPYIESTRRNITTFVEDFHLPQEVVLEAAYKPVHDTVYPRLRPLLNTITNPETQKKILNRIIFFTMFVLLFSGALLMYTAFYNMYLPTFERSLDVYMDYDHHNGYFKTYFSILKKISLNISVFAQVDLSIPYMDSNERFFKDKERFDLKFDIEIPESDANFLKNNFMVTVTTFDNKNETLKGSTRPGLVRHKSHLLRYLNTLSKSFFLVTGLLEESQVIRVDLLENCFEDTYNPTKYATLKINERNLQIYSTKLTVRKRLQGLAYLMVNRWFITGSVFVLIFMVLETIGLYFLYLARLLKKKYFVKEVQEYEDGDMVEENSVNADPEYKTFEIDTKAEIDEFFKKKFVDDDYVDDTKDDEDAAVPDLNTLESIN
ncbi:Berardinelli-Seip congenital lipodystrophy 2 (seipin), partial [Clydaea vesicula]